MPQERHPSPLIAEIALPEAGFIALHAKANGFSYNQIAEQMGVSRDTAANALRQVYPLFGFNAGVTRPGRLAIARLIGDGLIHRDNLTDPGEKYAFPVDQPSGALFRVEQDEGLKQSRALIVPKASPGAIGKINVPPGERTVLHALGSGQSATRVGYNLSCGRETVKTMYSRAFARLGVRTAEQAVAEAALLGVITFGNELWKKGKWSFLRYSRSISVTIDRPRFVPRSRRSVTSHTRKKVLSTH